MNLELTVEQKVVVKEALRSFWQECPKHGDVLG